MSFRVEVVERHSVHAFMTEIAFGIQRKILSEKAD